MQDNIPEALIAAFERHYDFPWNEPTLRNERLAWRAAWAEETKPCLHQIQEPAAAEQAAWHAGLDEGLAQATGSVSNATSQAAPAAVAVPSMTIAGALFDFCGYLTTLPRQQAITASEAHEASPMVEALEQWATKRNLQLDDADVKGWRAALAATPSASAVPDGWKRVPVVCTNEICCAIEREIDSQLAASGIAGPMHRQDGAEIWNAALAATPAAAPAGWKLVPIEPTSEMLESAGAADRDGTPATYKTLYMAMVGASPAAAPVVLPEPAREILEDAVSILSSINHGKQHAVKVVDEVCYWQRQEWIDWAEKEVLPKLRALLATATGLPAQAVELSDAELIALNAGECFFSESPSKYPEAGHGTQYHGGATGVIGFARAALALRADPAAYSQKFQQRVQPWMMACFGPEISADRIERNHRFLEEALELVQCLGCTASEAHQLVDYVYGRPWGDPAQEAGGVMVTLAALCLANGLDMHACGETELARIWTKVEAIRAKQAAKPKHSPLPISAPHLPSVQESVEKLPRYTYGYKGDDWGMNQSLRSYEAPDGAFLRRDEVLNAIAAITAKGNEV